MAQIKPEFIDDLTQIYNRRYFCEQVQLKLKETLRTNLPLSIVLIDLDHFKNINDTYGHQEGDQILSEFANSLKGSLRGKDMVFRYGGDEFVCILPYVDNRYAIRIAERVVEQCHQTKFGAAAVTVSIGIASAPQHATDWQKLFRIADQNLYAAKRHGRDRIGFIEKYPMRLNIPTQEMVGRDLEIDLATNLVKGVLAGKGGVLFISGEVGVGKTRLAQEVINKYQPQKIRILKSNLSTTTTSIPYYPFREFVRTVLSSSERKIIGEIPWAYQIELVKIVPELSGHAGGVSQDITVVDKYRLFEGARRFLELQYTKHPVFIFVDNIHWADDGFLELLHYLVRTLKDQPVFFFLVYRIEELKNGALNSIIQLMARERLAEKIELAPLQAPDVSRMLSLILDRTAPPNLTEYICHETGGNPFFIEELVKSLEASRALRSDNGNLIFDEQARVDIPDSVEGVIDRKLNLLDSETLLLLEYSSVMGKEFDFAFLKSITSLKEGRLFDLLDKLISLRLLKEVGSERYCFPDDIIWKIVYHRLGKVKTGRMHQVIADEIMRTYPGNVEELSRHFFFAGDLRHALEYSLRAADKARNTYAFTEALKFYDRVIECLPADTTPESGLREVDALKKKGEILNLIGKNDKAEIILLASIEKAQRQGQIKEEADCRDIVFNVYYNLSQYDKARQQAEAALELYRRINLASGEARSLNNIGKVYNVLGEHESALQFCGHALKIARDLKDIKCEAEVLNNVGNIYTHTGESSKSLQIHQAALQIHKEIGDRRGEARTYNNLAIVYFNSGESKKALEFYQRALKMVEEMGDQHGVIVILNNIGVICHRLYEYQKALEYYERVTRLSEETGDRSGEASGLCNIGALYSELGNYDQALEFFRRSLKIVRDIGGPHIEVEILLGIGYIEMELKNFEEAEKCHEKARVIVDTTKSKALSADFVLSLAGLHLCRDRLRPARECIIKGLALAQELGSKEEEAQAYSLFGQLYAREKKWKEAKDSFTRAIEINKALNKKFELAQVHYHQGEMFEKAGNKDSARESIAYALHVFEELGAEAWLRKIGQ